MRRQDALSGMAFPRQAAAEFIRHTYLPLVDDLPSFRATPPDQYHVTLAYFGPTSPQDVSYIGSRLEELRRISPEDFVAFKVEAYEFGYFPDNGAVHLKLRDPFTGQPPIPMGNLLRTGLKSFGISVDTTHPFRGILTLGRITDFNRNPELRLPEHCPPCELVIDQLVLVSTTYQDDWTRYYAPVHVLNLTKLRGPDNRKPHKRAPSTFPHIKK